MRLSLYTVLVASLACVQAYDLKMLATKLQDLQKYIEAKHPVAAEMFAEFKKCPASNLSACALNLVKDSIPEVPEELVKSFTGLGGVVVAAQEDSERCTLGNDEQTCKEAAAKVATSRLVSEAETVLSTLLKEYPQAVRHEEIAKLQDLLAKFKGGEVDENSEEAKDMARVLTRFSRIAIAN